MHITQEQQAQNEAVEQRLDKAAKIKEMIAANSKTIASLKNSATVSFADFIGYNNNEASFQFKDKKAPSSYESYITFVDAQNSQMQGLAGALIMLIMQGESIEAEARKELFDLLNGEFTIPAF